MGMAVNKPLIPLKLLMFLIHGGISALLPFMGIHMKSLGLTVTETALILTILPFVSAVGPPLGGIIADKLGNYKLVYMVATLFSIFVHCLLYWVVPACLPETASSASFLLVNATLPYLNIKCLPEGETLILDQICPVNYMVTTPAESAQACSCFTECASDICVDGQPHALATCLRMFENVCRTGVAECALKCQLLCGTQWNCRLTNQTTVPSAVAAGDRVTTLASYSVLRFVSTTFMWLAVPLSDSAAVVMARENNAQLGPQKMFSQLGFCVLPPLSSALVAWATKAHGYEDYGPAFYLFAAMHLLSIIVVFFLQMGARLPAANLAANMGKVLSDRRVLSMAVVVFLIGCGFGVCTGFLFWFMEEDLKSPKYILGLTQTVAGLFGFPAMFFAAPIIRLVGHSRIFALGLMAYSVRFLGMSFIPAGQAYLVLLLQPLEAISHSLVIVVAADYGGQLSPKYVASLQGIIFAAHYCFGKGGGSLLGTMKDYVGWRTTFKILSIIFASLAVVYLLVDYFFIYRHRLRLKTEMDERNAESDIKEEEEAERKKKLLSGAVSAISEYSPPNSDSDADDEHQDDNDGRQGNGRAVRVFPGNSGQPELDVKNRDLQTSSNSGV